MKIFVDFFIQDSIDYLSRLLFSMGSGLFFLFTIYFHTLYGFSIVQSTTIVAIAGMGQFIGSLCSYRITYTIKNFINAVSYFSPIDTAKAAQIVLSLLASMILILMSHTHAYSYVCVECFLFGACAAAFIAVNVANLLHEKNIADSVYVSALSRWFQNIGTGIGLLGMAFFSYYQGQIFSIIGVLSLMVAILQIFKKNSGNAHISTKKKPKNIKKFSSTIKLKIGLWLLANLLAVIAYMQYLTTLPIFLHYNYSINTAQFSHLLLINIAIVILFQNLVPQIASVISTRYVSVMGVLLIGISFTMVALSKNLMILSFILWSLGDILFFGVSQAYIKLFSQTDANLNGYFSALYYAGYFGAKMLAALIGGFLYHHTGGSFVLFFAFVTSIFSGMIFFMIKTEKTTEHTAQNLS